ncbi:MAG: alkaline phosphatase family protein, partial [Solirubrobacteraceae bacterium]
ALDHERRAELVERSVQAVRELDGVDLVLWLAAPREAVVASTRGELRFAPGGDVKDFRGRSWSIEGQLETLGASVRDGRWESPDYPDALSRVWSALTCPTAGDVLLSAQPGYEFVDWGGADHVGGGSHGSLHRSDSLGALLWCGTGPDSANDRLQWSLRDIAPMVRNHFGLGSAVSTD